MIVVDTLRLFFLHIFFMGLIQMYIFNLEIRHWFRNEACALRWRSVNQSMNTCINVLARFGGMHGTMAHGWLHCPLWLNDSSAGKELVDGGTEVHNLSWLQRPVIQLGLSHALSQSYGASTRANHQHMLCWLPNNFIKLSSTPKPIPSF